MSPRFPFDVTPFADVTLIHHSLPPPPYPASHPSTTSHPFTTSHSSTTSHPSTHCREGTFIITLCKSETERAAYALFLTFPRTFCCNWLRKILITSCFDTPWIYCAKFFTNLFKKYLFSNDNFGIFFGIPRWNLLKFRTNLQGTASGLY